MPVSLNNFRWLRTDFHCRVFKTGKIRCYNITTTATRKFIPHFIIPDKIVRCRDEFKDYCATARPDILMAEFPKKSCL
ncbi:MAG: hypothetical protein DRI57_24535, partial [Deltaproteobacteria bacterium]